MINIKKLLNLNYYTSELDQFLQEYDNLHPRPTASQQFEIDKYREVFAKRDFPKPESNENEFWDKF